MNDRSKVIKVLVACMLCFACLQNKSNAQQDQSGLVHDDTLGIIFAKVGAVVKIDSTTFHITMPPSENSAAQPAMAQVTATDRLFIDLPGSYGGRLYYDEPAASTMIENKVMTDSVQTGQQNFRREYWAVYAGMGMWEGVINCYTLQAGRYYVVSLVQEIPAGKPGEDSGDKPLTAENLKMKVLDALRDTTNVAVTKFTTMLNSVQVNK
jgi:hypothetical protein